MIFLTRHLSQYVPEVDNSIIPTKKHQNAYHNLNQNQSKLCLGRRNLARRGLGGFRRLWRVVLESFWRAPAALVGGLGVILARRAAHDSNRVANLGSLDSASHLWRHLYGQHARNLDPHPSKFEIRGPTQGRLKELLFLTKDRLCSSIPFLGCGQGEHTT